MSDVKYLVLGTLVNILVYLAINDVYFYESSFASVSEGSVLTYESSEAPFMRSVFIVADGLRGDIFFRYPEWHPFLTNVSKQPGSFWGQTKVTGPTDPVLAHMTMFAGSEVEPLAAYGESLPGVDTVFTHVPCAVGIGLEHVLMKIYEDDPNKTFLKLGQLREDDQISLKSFAELIHNGSISRTDKALMFLHLMQIDSLGHFHTGSSRNLTQAVKVLDALVAKVSSLVNEYFGDNKTLFVLTSGHGMGDLKHSFPSPEETIVPFVVWGHNLETRQVQFGIRQVDWAPTLAAALGISIPSNSVGRVVHQLFPDKWFAYEALLTNYFQLTILANVKETELEKKLLFVLHYGNERRSLQWDAHREFIYREYESAISKMDEAITLALDEIRYFRNYDRRCVQVIITVVVLLWLVLLAMFVLADIDAAVLSRRAFVLSGGLAMFLVKGYGWPLYRSIYLLALFLMTFCIGRGFYRNSASKVTLVATTLGAILTRSTLLGCGIQLQNIFPELLATMVSFSSFQLVPIRKPLQMDVFFFTGYSVILGLLAMQPPVGLRSFAPVPPDSLYRTVGVLATFAGAFSKPTCSSKRTSLSKFEKNLVTFYKVFIVLIGICLYFPNLLITKAIAWSSLLLAYTVPVLVSNQEAFFIFLATSVPYLCVSISYEAIFYAVLFAYLSAWSRMKIRPENSMDHTWVHLVAVTLLFYGQTRPYHIGEFEEILTQVLGKLKPYDTFFVLLSKYLGPLTVILALRMDFVYATRDYSSNVSRLEILLQGQSMTIVTFLLISTTGTYYDIKYSLVNHVVMAFVPWSLTCIDYLLDWIISRNLSRTARISVLLYTPLVISFAIFVYSDIMEYFDN